MKMSNMSYNEFLADVSLEYENDSRRGTRDNRKYGKVYVDYLLTVRPKIASKLLRSLLNPSVRDNCPPAVHEYVEKLWSKSNE
jgi:hypothetical protein